MIFQREFNFDRGQSEQGYTEWITARKIAARELARHINLPLGHQVEVWLEGGVRLRGELRLPRETLFIKEDAVRHLELTVDGMPFATAKWNPVYDWIDGSKLTRRRSQVRSAL